MPAEATVADEILELLAKAGRPLSPSEIADKMPSTDKSYIRKELVRLLGKKEISRPRRGQYEIGSTQNVPHKSLPVSASAPDHGDGSATVEPDDIGTETRAHVTARADLRRDVTLPVVEVSAGTGGSLSIKDLTLYHQAVSEDHFTSLFHRPPPKHPDEHPYALGLLRGESMVPRYFDRQLVPLELFEPSDDAPAGNVYLVRLDGHLHLKVLDRIPGRTHEGEIVPPTIILSSYHRSYMPMRVPLDGSIDFAVLGSVVETGQQKLYGALLAERFGFQ